MSANLFPPPFAPDYAAAPGDILREHLEKLGLSQSDLAERTLRPKKTINEIIQGKAAITLETALQFERALRIPASFWLNLERTHQAVQARQIEREQLATHVGWLDKVPVAEIVKRGWIKPQSDRVELLREVLAFFGTAYPSAWDEVWRETRKATALRQGKAEKVDFGIISVWLRQGEILGRQLECAPYNAAAFRQALDHVRTLTHLPAEKFCEEIQKRCAAVGVAVVLVREFPRLGIFGAARWLSSDKALIQLSLHYKREDQFVFSFFHEAGHVLLHGRRDIFVDFADRTDDKQELEANRFAADYLIPPAAYARFTAREHYSESAVVQFARHVSVAPGIVVGRLQHENKIGFNELNHLHRKVRWSAEGTPVRVP